MKVDGLGPPVNYEFLMLAAGCDIGTGHAFLVFPSSGSRTSSRIHTSALLLSTMHSFIFTMEELTIWGLCEVEFKSDSVHTTIYEVSNERSMCGRNQTIVTV